MTITAAVKSRPILFSGPMVRALIEGRKTQTRRAVKPQPDSPCVMAPEIAWLRDRATCIWPAAYELNDGSRPDYHAICPYGKPGDRLWVRETWALIQAQYEHEDGYPTKHIYGFYDFEGRPGKSRPAGFDLAYRADGDFDDDDGLRCFAWRPSIHMPRWASRITLEITGVRVERLTSITEEDAIAEGVGPGYVPNSAGSTSCVGHRPMFTRIWNEIHGFGSWAIDPWVWAISFRRIA